MRIANTFLAFSVALAATTATPGQSAVVGAESRELNCLARNIYHEARGEGKKGMLAVAHVTMNRVAAGGFPDTVCGVVNQKNSKACQFSWVCDKSTRLASAKQLGEATTLARKVYAGHARDFTGGATYFHHRRVKPKWAGKMRSSMKLGNHIFYRNPR